jgi:hypothetical protein
MPTSLTVCGAGEPTRALSEPPAETITVLEIQSEGLVPRPTIEEDLDALLDVRISNPDRLAQTEGSDGVPGRCHHGMLERDCALTQWDPNRETATREWGHSASLSW